MITMFSAIRLSWGKAAIIGLCLLALSGCSALRVAYNQAPTLVWWWLDGYVGFNAEQAPRVKDALQQWFAWNRAEQLPIYAQLLASAQVQIEQPATPAQACRWVEDLRALLEPALAKALPLAAEITPALGPAQFAHIEGKYRKVNEKFEGEYLQDEPQERLKASVKRATERAEKLYGDLSTAQRRLLATGLAASPFDAQVWFAERQAVQRETLQTLRQASAAPSPVALTALQALAQRVLHPSGPYRAYRQRLQEYNCALFAELHNSTTPAQRQTARARLRGWQDDLRALSGRGG
jgi:hypothetical protein